VNARATTAAPSFKGTDEATDSRAHIRSSFMIGDALSTVWAIGDLHADAHCARAWVRRTGLIDGLHQNVSPEKWDWAEPASTLVFMGDYVDKGPYARSTLNFVRTLNERFGDERVQAILGNHEVNLLVDRATPQGHRYLNYAYAAAHPAQYAEWTVQRQGNVTAVAEETANMRQALDLLLKALDHLYVTGAYDPQSVLMTPSGRASILHHIPVAQRSLVASELARWQAAYLRGVGPSTPEGAWLSRRPLTVRVAGLVFVHGGVHPTATAAELDEINAAVARSLLPQADLAALGKLLQQRPEIRELVEDRRLHKSCDRVLRALASLNVTRIAVGSSH